MAFPNNFKRPVCVFSTDANASPVQVVDLEKILFGHDTDLRKLKVAVISIAGKPRKGKSFLMNLILRYLESDLDPSFLENPDETFHGFDWRNCRDAVTKGVQLWPKAFKVRRPNGEEMAVILVDTQGIYDNKSTTRDSFNIFTFGTLVSSTVIFNVHEDIQGDDLGKLKLFIDYGRMLRSDTGHKHEGASKYPSTPRAPFQNLIFLIRDWPFVQEFDYGWRGGEQLLTKLLMSNDLPKELLEQRSSIADAFETTKAYLMPEPEKNVRKNPNFRGAVRDMGKEFVTYMKPFVKDLIDPTNLIPKTVCGREITLEEFCSLIGYYSTRFTKESLKPEDLDQHIVNAEKTAIIRKCVNRYNEHMQKNLKQDPNIFKGLIHREAEGYALHCLMDSPLSYERNMAEFLKKELYDSLQLFAITNESAYNAARLEAAYKETERLVKKREKEIQDLHAKREKQAQQIKDNEDFVETAFAVAGAILAGGAFIVAKLIFRL